MSSADCEITDRDETWVFCIFGAITGIKIISSTQNTITKATKFCDKKIFTPFN